MSREIKYKKEIDETLKKIVKGVSMPNSTDTMLMNQILIAYGGYDNIVRDLDKGLESGYSIEEQLSLVETIFHSLINAENSNLTPRKD